MNTATIAPISTGARPDGGMDRRELLALPAAVTIPTAARALGCGRSLAYDLARRGRFPCRVLRVGNRYIVPTAELLRLLGVEPDGAAEEAEPSR